MIDKRILFVITEDWALISHRLHLIDAAISAGYEVGLVTRVNKHREILEAREIKIFEWNLLRRSLNPFREIMTLISLYRILWLFKPDIIFAVAQKPVIYAGIARKFYRKVAFIGTLGGIGFVFTSQSFKAKLLKPTVKLFLKFALKGKKTRLILQNKENINIFKNMNITDNKNIRLIKGAGVEIDKFKPSQIPKGIPKVILPCRMLWDKGVGEFVRVAERIKTTGIDARFILVGNIDPHNPESISQTQIDRWIASGAVEQWSRHNEMEKVYQEASIVCLPSYNEGLPKVLLEASSCSRPIIAFDVPGCREVVKNNINGFLVEFGNEHALEVSIVNLIKNQALCYKMGKKGRKIVESKFSSIIINTQTFNVCNEVI